LNFRVVLPPDHPHANAAKNGDFAAILEPFENREDIKEYDQLRASDLAWHVVPMLIMLQ
jgi:hypothetical protein